MTPLQAKAGVISALLLAIINALAGFGVVMPAGVDAQGVALLNSAILSVGALVAHFQKPAEPKP